LTFISVLQPKKVDNAIKQVQYTRATDDCTKATLTILSTLLSSYKRKKANITIDT